MAPQVYLVNAIAALCSFIRAAVSPPSPPQIVRNAPGVEDFLFPACADNSARRRAWLAGKLAAKLAARKKKKDTSLFVAAKVCTSIAASRTELEVHHDIQTSSPLKSLSAVLSSAPAISDLPVKDAHGAVSAFCKSTGNMEYAIRRCIGVESLAGCRSALENNADGTSASVGNTRNPESPTSVVDLSADCDDSLEMVRSNKRISEEEAVRRAARIRIWQLERRVQAQTEEMKWLKNKNTDLVTERDAALAGLERLNVECREMLGNESVAVTGLRRELRCKEEELQAAHDRLSGSRLRTSSILSAVRAELDRLHEALEEAQQDRISVHEELREDIALLKSEKSLLQHELKSAAARWAAQEASLTNKLVAESVKNAIASVVQAVLSEQVALLEVECAKLKHNVVEKNAELQVAEIERNSLHDDLEAHRTEHEKLAVELMQTNDEFRELQKHMRMAREMYQTTLNAIATDLKSALEQYHAVSVERDALRARTEILEKERGTGAVAKNRLVTTGNRLVDVNTRAPRRCLARMLRPERPLLLTERRARSKQLTPAREALGTTKGNQKSGDGRNLGESRWRRGR